MNRFMIGQGINAVSYMAPPQYAVRPQSVQAAVTPVENNVNEGSSTAMNTLMYGGLALAGLALIWALTFGSASE